MSEFLLCTVHTDVAKIRESKVQCGKNRSPPAASQTRRCFLNRLESHFGTCALTGWLAPLESLIGYIFSCEKAIKIFQIPPVFCGMASYFPRVSSCSRQNKLWTPPATPRESTTFQRLHHESKREVIVHSTKNWRKFAFTTENVFHAV